MKCDEVWSRRRKTWETAVSYSRLQYSGFSQQQTRKYSEKQESFADIFKVQLFLVSEKNAKNEIQNPDTKILFMNPTSKNVILDTQTNLGNLL